MYTFITVPVSLFYERLFQRSRDLEEQLQLSRSSATTPQSEDSGEVKASERSAEPSEHTSSPAPSADQQERGTPASPSVIAGLVSGSHQAANRNEIDMSLVFTETVEDQTNNIYNDNYFSFYSRHLKYSLSKICYFKENT